MRIGIDARLLERRTTGIGRFLCLLLDYFAVLDKENEYYLFTYEPTQLYGQVYKNIPTRGSKLPQKLFSPYWNNFILPKYLEQKQIDVFISVNQIIPLVKVKKCKFISVVHDVIHLKDSTFLPYFYRLYMKLYVHFSIKASHKIITVSEFSRRDILLYYPEAKEKVVAFHEAIASEFQKVELTDVVIREFREKYTLPGPVILYVGVLENRKNIGTIIKIADRIAKVNSEAKFVLVGRIGYGGNRFLREIRTRHNMLHLQGVPDETLNILYNISTLFLFPSFYEGFGLPPLEAMNAGLPVLASNSTSIPEVLGDAAILHAPDDIDAFVSDIRRLIDDEKERKLMQEKGLERVKLFDQETMTRKFLAVINSLRAENQ